MKVYTHYGQVWRELKPVTDYFQFDYIVVLDVSKLAHQCLQCRGWFKSSRPVQSAVVSNESLIMLWHLNYVQMKLPYNIIFIHFFINELNLMINTESKEFMFVASSHKRRQGHK